MTTTNLWLTSRRDSVPDVEIIEEAALAMAQSTVQSAIDLSGCTRAELARRLDRPRSFISRILRGDHNLTIKTMARVLLACGFEVRFNIEPVAWSRPQMMEHTAVAIEGDQTGTDLATPLAA